MRKNLRQPAESSLHLNATVPTLTVMLSLGTNVFIGGSARGMDAGLRAGLLLGGRASHAISANAELVIDRLNPTTSPDFSVSEFMFELTFSPLLHTPVGNGAQFVIGPRLGLWYLTESVSGNGTALSAWGWGTTVGGNAGVLVPAGSARVGFLLGFGVRAPATLCFSGSGESETCTSADVASAKVLGISLVVMPEMTAPTQKP